MRQVSSRHNEADTFGAGVQESIHGAKYVTAILKKITAADGKSFSYQLKAVNRKLAKQVDFVASSMEDVENDVLGRVGFAYWRPLVGHRMDPKTNKGLVLVPTLDGPYVPAWKGNKAARASASASKPSASAAASKPPVATTQSLSTSPRLDLFRKAAFATLVKQGRRMQKQAAKKQGLEGIGALEIGTIVHLRLADVDRAKLDNTNATLVVLDVTAKQNYTVGNQAGIYKEKVSRVHLTPLSHATPAIAGLEELLADYQDESRRASIPTLGIRKIAAATSAAGGQGMVKCHCRGACDTKRCSCFKAGRQCNSRCHPKNRCCTNHD